jgi:hypothetical protein
VNKTAADRDLFPGTLEMMILRTLQRQPQHGYALAQHIKRMSNDLLQIEDAVSGITKIAAGRAGECPLGRVCDQAQNPDI